ncbi:MAG: hypothetical protein J0M12_09550 [Deltaproteobacteria bacterium]|nr:hypothetical protein [Deltaproteobacteria bacterium]
MQKPRMPLTASAANESDYTSALCTVSICFADPMINHLFSELLEARGVKTAIVPTIEAAARETKIITEPQFFPDIETTRHGECLVVGNKESLKSLNVLSLSRPLTEEKIESALEQFLSK